MSNAEFKSADTSKIAKFQVNGEARPYLEIWISNL